MTQPQPPIEACPVCGSAELQFWTDPNTWTCPDCGYVVDEESLEKPSIELDVEIDGDGSEADDGWKERVSVMDKSEANLVEVLELVEELVASLPVSEDLSIRAAEIVTEAWEANIMHGRTKEATVGAAVYAASRESQRAIPPGAISESVGTEKQAVKRVYQQIKAECEVNVDPATPAEYVEYICAALDLPNDHSETAGNLLTGKGFRGGNPIGIAAAGVHEVSSDVTLREAASVTSLTKETIWRHADSLRRD